LPHTGLDEEFDAGSLEELDNSFEEESSNESLEDEFADEVPDEIVTDEEEDDAGDDEVTTEGKPEIKPKKKKVGKGMSPMIKLAGIATLSVALIGGAVFMFMPEINKMMGSSHPRQVVHQNAPVQIHQPATKTAALSNPKPEVSQAPTKVSDPVSKGASLAAGIGKDSNTSMPGNAPGTSLNPEKDAFASKSDPNNTPKVSSSQSKIIAGMNAMIDRLNNLNVQVSKLSYDSSNTNSAKSNDDSIVLKKLIRKVDTLNKRIRTANRNITKLRRSANHTRHAPVYHASRALKPAVYPVHKVRHIKYIVMAAVPGTAWVYHAKDVHGKYKPTGDVFKLSDGDTIKGYGKVTRITSDGKIMCEHGSLPTKVLE